MKTGFKSIRFEDYVALHLRANPGTKRSEVIKRLEYAIDAHRKDVRCQCGAPIWIIGSAEAGLACFTCITGEVLPDNDYEIEVSAKGVCRLTTRSRATGRKRPAP